MRRRSARKRRAPAAVMTAVLQKTSRGGKALKVDIKTRKPQKAEGETRTVPRGTVMMKKKGKNALTVAKSESRTLTKTLTQGQTQKRRGGKTGEQRVRRARMIVLETEMHRHLQTHSSGNDQENYCRFLCSPLLHRGLFSAGPFCIVLC